jgi:pilus assembly protein CpaE
MSDFDTQIAPVPRISIQAFCETQNMADVIAEASGDRRMAKAQLKVQMGGADGALEAYREAPTPNLIVIETRANRDALLDKLEQLAEFCDASTKVVVLGHVNDILLYRELISRGVSDYLVAPMGVLDFVRAVSSLYGGEGSSAIGRVIAVVGAKGGAGASTIAHNVAWAIAGPHEIATILVDLDLPAGTAALNFNHDPPQGVADAIYAPDRVDHNFVDRLLTKCSDQLSMLAAPATLDRIYDLDEMALDPLIEVLRSTTPVTILDVPKGWNGWIKRVLLSADDVVIAAEPDLANLRNAKNLLDQLRVARPNDRAPRLVLNKVGVLKRPEIAPADFGKNVDCAPMAVIPFEPKLFGSAANNGRMILEEEGGAPFAQHFDEIARELVGRPAPRKQKKGVLDPLLSRLSRKKA